jgi:hypothetical protein
MELDQGRTRDQGWWFGRLELEQAVRQVLDFSLALKAHYGI